jgi:hypothetical protein
MECYASRVPGASVEHAVERLYRDYHRPILRYLERLVSARPQRMPSMRGSSRRCSGEGNTIYRGSPACLT